MKIKDILAKVAKGEELTAEEKQFLSEYEEPAAGDGDNKIPKSRLDGEIQKRKKAEEDLQTLQDKFDELEEKLESLESSGLSETEKLKKEHGKELKKLQDEVAALTAERDDAVGKMTKYERSGKVREIADKHKFSDAEYLDYLFNSKEIDLEKEADVSKFMSDLGSSRPELFASSARSGSGTGGTQGATEITAAKKEFEELMKKKEMTAAEAGRVIELSEKLKSEEQNNNQGE